jgi:hypothetical protein
VYQTRILKAATTDPLLKLNGVNTLYNQCHNENQYKIGSDSSRELSKYKLDLVGVQSDRRAVAPNLQDNTHFSTERGMRIMN